MQGIAATISSIIIPKPPLNFFSNHFMGNGFITSKNRNIRNDKKNNISSGTKEIGALLNKIK